MTLLFVDSFEHYDSAGMQKKWNAYTSTDAPSTTTARNGKSVRADSAYGMIKQLESADEHATLIVGCAFRFNVLPAGSTAAMATFTGDDHATNHIAFCMDPTGHILIKRGNGGGTLLATSASVVTATNTWHYYEFKVTLSDTVGLAECRVDGVATPVVTFSGDTKNGGTDTVFDSINMFASSLGTAYADDLYLCNGAGSINNDYLGDCIVECLFPTSDSATNTGLTPSTGANHWATVDESPENTSDYNSSNTLNNLDTYGMGDLVTPSGTVYGVQVVNYAQKDITGLRKVASAIRRSGANYAGADKAVGFGFVFYPEIFEQDPSTSAAWTVAGVNAAEIGAKVR